MLTVSCIILLLCQVPGYYADTDADCQLYHICAGPENGLVKYDFLCPNGTLFDQQYFVCNWWFNVDCALVNTSYKNISKKLKILLKNVFNLNEMKPLHVK